VPILLNEVIQNDTIQRGQIIALSGFGGGLTVGTQIIKY
jgi:3-oxoacyl-[acyl-carrier-protein] synthase-3